MKTLYLLIIAILLSSIIGFGLAYAEQPLLDFYNASDRVLVGTIISSSQVHTITGDKTQYPNQTRYDIHVEQYYKDPQDFKLVTVYGYAKGIYLSQDPTFDVGDRVFLYLIKKNGFYQIQSPSFKLDNNCDARPMVPLSVLPFESPAISSPASKSPFDFIDSNGNKSLSSKVREKIHINFIATNYLPMVKYTTLNFQIKTDNDTKSVFNYTKQIMLPACNGNVPLSWDFVPEDMGSYSVFANMSSSINMGGAIFLFTEPTVKSSFDAFAPSYQNSLIIPDGSNPPVIITQVELSSPFALFPDNQTCYDKPGFTSTSTCTTDIIPGHKVQCAYFIGSSSCEPIHQYTSGTNHNCLDSQNISNAPQWFDVYNTLNKTVQLQYFTVRVPTPNGSYSEAGPYYTISHIGPHEKCTYGFHPVDEPISLDPTNKTILISYDYDGKHYAAYTPLLSDVYNDTRTWQYDGSQWIFTDSVVSIPEFPFAIPVLLVSITSLVVFYRIKI